MSQRDDPRFRLPYGLGRLCQEYNGLTLKQAECMRESYFRHFPEFKKWWEETQSKLQTQKGSYSVTGRERVASRSIYIGQAKGRDEDG